MTAASTTTLLDMINKVLLDVGERRVTAITSPTAQKCKEYIQDSLIELQTMHDWEWLYSTITPSSWNLDTVTITGVQRVLYASWVNLPSGNTSNPYTRLIYLDPESYDATVSVLGFSSVVETASRPFYWTFTEYNTFKISPYPTDAAGQARVKLYVVLAMEPPTTNTGVFPIPEYLIPLLRYLADSKMYEHHLGDMNGAQSSFQKFQMLLNQYRTRQAKHPVGGQMSMYKRNRRYP